MVCVDERWWSACGDGGMDALTVVLGLRHSKIAKRVNQLLK
jgi:hypothetical protein